MKTLSHFVIILGITLILVLTGCLGVKKDVPSPTSGAVAVHTGGWSDTLSMNFHGNAIRNAG